ncbi:fimbrial protein precursor [Clostridium acetireducens DSM 10703]|uniref:Fimbrial protein n=1 Tax=Clostridium acetireducens DSM 10703 TaxID=1121290 RepID=A0A1E8F1R9_9CLOT|nr:type II secretion system protein [Clostridium acetireducens]OFI07576.1 fimbrial protein precursor [Clostridium acetireducens DSM 10703]
MKGNKKGFTLIELMVVIAIIIVLAGFLVPKFIGYQEKAKNVKAINTAKQIHTAVMGSYAEENGEFVEEKIIDSITNLTGAKSIDIEGECGEDNVDINFQSDKKQYTVSIDANKSYYEVKQGKNTIFCDKSQDVE